MKHTLKLLFVACLLSFSNLAMSKPVTYQVDTEGMHASINFKIQHLGYSWLTGRFENFKGEYVYDSENLSNSNIRIEIETKSINSNHAERDKHLRSDDFLSVNKHPTSTFVSESITGSDDNMQIKGKLTLNGVTKNIEISAAKIGEGKDPWGGYRSGFEGSTQLKLSDFDITKNLGPASTHVLLELHIEGIKK